MTNLDNSNLPVFISNSLGSVQGTLLSGEIATYTATYTIVADDVTAGGVMNQAFAQTFSYPDGINPVLSASDYSDDGDDDDGNTEILYPPDFTSGDSAKGDGIYTFKIPIYGDGFGTEPLDDTTRTGPFRWRFSVQDMANDYSQTVDHVIIIQ